MWLFGLFGIEMEIRCVSGVCQVSGRCVIYRYQNPRSGSKSSDRRDRIDCREWLFAEDLTLRRFGPAFQAVCADSKDVWPIASVVKNWETCDMDSGLVDG